MMAGTVDSQSSITQNHDDFLASFSTLSSGTNEFAHLLVGTNTTHSAQADATSNHSSTKSPDDIEEELLPVGQIATSSPGNRKLRFDNFVEPVINDAPQQLRVKGLDEMTTSSQTTDKSSEMTELTSGYVPSVVEQAQRPSRRRLGNATASSPSTDNKHLTSSQQTLLEGFEQDLKQELRQLHSDMHDLKPLPRDTVQAVQYDSDDSDSDDDAIPESIASAVIAVEQVPVEAFKLDEEFDYEQVEYTPRHYS
eukprot:TRINITY_DN12292_c0_g2_i4.p1 TRINITY_DN12292_c0_g2~~TRINITY_DN12292_c0_g2_i4.p1  ORF type:complete len:252 (+),score=53.21 TRINITY_DN12292_c0_g2_i4:148-903(+)